MSRFYIYETATGKLIANNTVSYSKNLLAGQSEVELTPASRFHTTWDEAGAAGGSPGLKDNGGGRIKAAPEVYSDYEKNMVMAFDDYSSTDQAKILSQAPADILAVIQ